MYYHLKGNINNTVVSSLIILNLKKERVLMKLALGNY